MYTSRIVLAGALLLASFASVAGKTSFGVSLVVEDACQVDATRLPDHATQARQHERVRDVRVSCIASSPYAVTLAGAEMQEDTDAMTLTVSY
jgi:hypothetical protein